jgi:hypothetical protein
MVWRVGAGCVLFAAPWVCEIGPDTMGTRVSAARDWMPFFGWGSALPQATSDIAPIRRMGRSPSALRLFFTGAEDTTE